MRRRALAGVLAVLLPACAGRAVCAQEKVTLRSDLLLYGDNTEFRNPFREGETIFGAAVRVAVDLEINPRVSVALGGFGNQRFGSDQGFELARPVIALTVHGRRSAFAFGTLPPLVRRRAGRPRSSGAARAPPAAPARDAHVRSSL